ncbi:LpxI family protein [Halothermothrix orenii]|uniref:Uncharacterized protein conserved in bacteria n=1 Tax=Halothermothrix orenii (strain H 168 / OCM 544 / DSM 9562) TaxID=373903 RepID=B8CYY4_HALOH|nr:UDP-2,3-diacylglucosamine diphosphatase LpxI [Halothermothrix orenii]ACL70503.1 uncharacterized protein conserved in bacteria [Halothermothrix orenii H 168]
MSKIGLIAGRGKLPAIWAASARDRGHDVYAFPIIEEADEGLKNIAKVIKPVNVGAFDNLINILIENDISKVVMIGKVNKTRLFGKTRLDARMQQMLANLRELNDDSILLGIVNELKKEGIEVLKQSTFIEDLFPTPGPVTSKTPDDSLLEDMKYAFKLARGIGGLDIGQTVLVKNRAVLAVEAIEGTDQAIKRAGELGGAGATMAKVSKPNQDFRFDIPTVGLTTLRNLIKIKARGLVIEAGKTFIVDREEFIETAEASGITVMALESASPE